MPSYTCESKAKSRNRGAELRSTYGGVSFHVLAKGLLLIVELSEQVDQQDEAQTAATTVPYLTVFYMDRNEARRTSLANCILGGTEELENLVFGSV